MKLHFSHVEATHWSNDLYPCEGRGKKMTRTRACHRIVVPRHGERDLQFSHVENLDVVVDSSADHLLVVPRQANSCNLVLVHELSHGSPNPRVPEFDEAVVGAGSDQVARARYGAAVHYSGVSLMIHKSGRVGQHW